MTIPSNLVKINFQKKLVQTDRSFGNTGAKNSIPKWPTLRNFPTESQCKAEKETICSKGQHLFLDLLEDFLSCGLEISLISIINKC